ncbi:ATP(GTP)-binding protein Fet5 [Reticulomyxa filosa]|uniref:GPN-loop GTPase 3 n=1 Tax=Reticulomyxa filosa TaxID=46433 RepID=X6NQU1_RETFI|nr:ATP(GTP)-binding protein Fet5 [Reticulomyxa filosa]|eukprot:ETO28670.1 ATP(GTP)-binding protein Fet5 [Reticulomyxa filosa]
MKYAQLVIGPAGSGKSSYCRAMQQHCQTTKRSVHVVNLDPAADDLVYDVSFDIRELIGLDDVAEELELGPNGGLIFCMEYFMENIEWFQNKIGDYEDDYLFIDCPGQIELYRQLLEKMGYRMCSLYLLDCNFIGDGSKFISGILSSLSAMLQLELPHINLLTKVDLLESETKRNKESDDSANDNETKGNEKEKEQENEEDEEEALLDLSHLDEYFDPDITELINKVNASTSRKYFQMTKAIGDLIQCYNMVSFLPFSCRHVQLIENILRHCDHCMQFGEDAEPKDPVDWDNASSNNKDDTLDDDAQSNQDKTGMANVLEHMMRSNGNDIDFTGSHGYDGDNPRA